MPKLCKFFLILVAIFPYGVFSNLLTKRFEYKHSFKPPVIARKDGSIPFWDRFGNAIANKDNIRVTPSLRSQRGSIWSRNKTDFEWWEIDISFRVSGRGRIGADGLAFWYLEDKGGEDGSVFGGPDMWKGLGIFFDSFDNDNQHNNPYIMAMVNDGTVQYDHQRDGGTQSLAGCIKDYRNKPFPLKAKIHYYNHELTMYFNNGLSKGEEHTEYELCLQAYNLNLTKFGYFGISAATGGLADDHDIQKFVTWSLKETFQFTPDNPNPEQIKYEKEYEGYQEKLDKQKEEYIKEHPEAGTAKKGETENNEEEYLYDEEYYKELRAIFQEQSSLKVYAQGLIKRLDEILGKHESITFGFNLYYSQTRSLLNKGPGQSPDSLNNGSIAIANVIERYETENILAANKELLTLNREIKELLRVIESVETLGGASSRPPPPEFPGIASADPEGLRLIDEVNVDLIQVRDGLNDLLQTKLPKDPVPPPPCPVPACVSTKAYVSFSIISTGIVVGYLFYKDNNQTPIKKFY